ncbi:MAG: tetratricopeptide repeat protein [Anaerolineales bacterium]|nr:tetratricopeptide repeat protein [Anaerolineales bacterium]
MFRDDYISRQIQIIVQVLARILGLSKGREFIDALNLLGMTFREQLGTDLDTFLTVPDDRMVDFLTMGQTEIVATMHSSMAIALLYTNFKIYQDNGRTEQGLPYLQKALSLLLEVELAGDNPPELPDFVPMVEDLVGEVDLHQLSTDSRGTLAFYLEREGDFAEAEKVLRSMLDDRPHDPDVHELVTSFYTYLLDEDDDDLVKGGLPRGEILQRLDELKGNAS